MRRETKISINLNVRYLKVKTENLNVKIILVRYCNRTFGKKWNMSTGDSEGVYRFLFNLKNGNDDDDIQQYLIERVHYYDWTDTQYLNYSCHDVLITQSCLWNQLLSDLIFRTFNFCIKLVHVLCLCTGFIYYFIIKS